MLLAWTFHTPNRRGLQYSRCAKMKELYDASITSLGTKRLILLSAQRRSSHKPFFLAD